MGASTSNTLPLGTSIIFMICSCLFEQNNEWYERPVLCITEEWVCERNFLLPILQHSVNSNMTGSIL